MLILVPLLRLFSFLVFHSVFGAGSTLFPTTLPTNQLAKAVAEVMKIMKIFKLNIAQQ